MTATRDPVDVIAEEFARRCRAGERPSVDEYLARYPELAQRLARVLPTVAMLEQLKPPSPAPTRPAPTLQAIPRELDDYEIVREIARGGMGIVLEAVQRSLGRRVALKILPPATLADPTMRARFAREAQAAARLNHPGIVPVYGIGHAAGLDYFAMQYIEGKTLAEVIPLADWVEAARMARDAAVALGYAHAQSVLHRDIKPGNLLLDPSGGIWVTDFGLARLLDQEGATQSGTVLGTLPYMAPEAIHGQFTPASDVYSLGATLYELLTGARPYDAAHPAALIGRINEGRPTPPRERAPGIPRDLETIVLTAMARDVDARYATADVLAADLDRLLADRPIVVRRTPLAERAWRWCRRNRAVAVLGVCLLMALSAAAVLGWLAFAQTRSALLREAGLGRDARREALRAREASSRAEANVRIGLDAFEAMFRAATEGDEPILPDEVGAPADAGETGPLARQQARLLAEVLLFYERFAAANVGVQGDRLALDSVRAQARVGELQRRLGRPLPAELAFGQSIAMSEALIARAPDDVDLRWTLAEARAGLGRVRVAQERHADAEPLYRQALRVADAGPATLAPRRLAALATWSVELARLIERRDRDAPEALATHRRAVTLWQRLVDGQSTLTRYHLHLAGAVRRVAVHDLHDERPGRARDLLRPAITALRVARERFARSDPEAARAAEPRRGPPRDGPHPRRPPWQGPPRREDGPPRRQPAADARTQAGLYALVGHQLASLHDLLAQAFDALGDEDAAAASRRRSRALNRRPR